MSISTVVVAVPPSPFVVGPLNASSPHRILAEADRHITRILASSLPFRSRVELCWSHLELCGRALDRLAAHPTTVVHVDLMARAW